MIFVYAAIVGALNHAYLAGQYPTLPQFLKLNGIVGEEISGIAATYGPGGAISQYFTYFPLYLVFAVVMVFLGFGIAGLLDPIMTVLLVSPWLAAAFLIGFVNSIFLWDQYFGYALGGGMIATILAIKGIKERGPKTEFLSLVHHGDGNLKYIVASILACAIVLMIISPHFIYSKNLNNLHQDYLFQTNSTEQQQLTQLKSILSLVPKNATLMAPFYVMPQMFARQYFELIPSGPNNNTVISTNTLYEADAMWFQPEYIVGDFNPKISLNSAFGNQVQNFINITGSTIVNGTATFNGPYSIVAYNGSAILLKLKTNATS
jgi:hypothetical protein